MRPGATRGAVAVIRDGSAIVSITNLLTRYPSHARRSHFPRAIIVNPGRISFIMASDQGVSLHRSTLSARGEQESGSVEQAAANPGESKRTRLCVLLGSGILQLPIWGTMFSIPTAIPFSRGYRLCHDLRHIPRVLL